MRFENKVLTLENVGNEFVEAFLHEADRLRSIGVEVTVKGNTISLKSSKFLKLTKSEVISEGRSEYELALAVEPDEELLKAFEALAPFVTVLYDWKAEKGYSNAKLVFNTKYQKFKVKCPFCGHIQVYCTHTLPAVYPPQCNNCSAKVLAEVGDFSDVCETISNFYPLTESPEISTSKDEIRTKDGKYIGLVVERDDDVTNMHTWLLFIKND